MIQTGQILPFRGKAPVLGGGSVVMSGAVVMGDVEIGQDVGIWFNAVVRGDIELIRIGDGSNVQDGSVLHVTPQTGPLRIGRGVTIGHMAMLHGCTIEDDALIGMSATVLDGAIIGRESVVAAGAVVLSGAIIPPRSLVAGTPAKIKRQLTDEEVEGIRENGRHYVEILDEYRDEGLLPR